MNRKSSVLIAFGLVLALAAGAASRAATFHPTNTGQIRIVVVKTTPTPVAVAPVAAPVDQIEDD